MVSAGIDTPAELARRMKLHRQTVHKWMAGRVTELTPEMLFLLSDVLSVNARWLALGPPASPVKPPIMDTETQELLQLRKALESVNPKLADKWISDGRELVTIMAPKSPANPYAKLK